MPKLQAYLFGQIILPLIAILGGLTLVALLTQGLSRLDIIVDQRQSGIEFLWITLLAMPQVIALILPLGLFFAVAYALNRLLTENELVASYAAGMSRMQILAPILRLATIVALVHLALTTLVQPAAYRELRESLFSMRADLAAALVREGAFTSPAPGLTIYASETDTRGGMRDLLIDDVRNGPEDRVTYTARRGALGTSNGAPAIVLWEGQIQQPKEDGGIDLLNFDQYVVEFADFQGETTEVLLKSSDRFLSELFFPDLTHYYDQRNVDDFLAEGHGRIAGPLMNIALALIAVAALLSGDLNRLGYGRRLGAAAAIALVTRVAALGVQAACSDAPELNALQYLFPIGVGLAALAVILRSRPEPKRRAKAPGRAMPGGLPA